MIEKILLFEVNASNFNRLIMPLANYFVENGISKKAIMVHDKHVPIHQVDRSKLSPSVSIEKINDIYDYTKKNAQVESIVFFTNGYRIADIYWTRKFRKAGAKCYQVQHGMYAEFLKRDFFGYFSSIGKKLSYLRFLSSIVFKLEIGLALYLVNKDFIKSFYINNLIKRNFKKSISPALSHHVFVWGEYWKQWFIDNHFYNLIDNFTVVGNPDYHVFIKDKELEVVDEGTCYIAQTLVEDGRMAKEDFKGIIDRIADLFKEKMIIKLHPRSDKGLYERVVENGGKLTYGFPVPKIYLGHYSSLLALAIGQNVPVYILKINNEDIPDYYVSSATKIFDTVEELISFDFDNCTNGTNGDINYYFENKQEHPFKMIGEKLFSLKDGI
ncbi:hypothetical protein MTsPCn9_15220 [Croceitalea sp. MTPC9]|uniref:hypothetical protein n=1 Tax=unclassified Croceitalea TaxID=2632280 RepID=UPI002B37AC3F|nr:hypothetical protein MTsPCn6_13910 [Croceitalea sp. MTPC6]GMN16586.1 hypothetical protein MTsPCn9_15220 [Croceitalea sp. MTPC9]